MQPGGRNPDTSSYNASALRGRRATRAAQIAAATADWDADRIEDDSMTDGFAYPVPDSPKLAGKVTATDIGLYPEYYVSGPGRAAAEGSDCPHGYRMTDSCPNCP